MPRPRSLTTAQLAAAALAVIDRDGLDALTMRTVAAELGISTMGLYRYVDGRDQLEALVVELVLTDVDTTPAAGDTPWRGAIGTLAERVRVAVGAHPAVVPLLMTHRHRSPHLLRWSETVLGILTAAGYDGPARVTALRAITGYMVGVLQLQHLGPLAGAGTKVIAAQSDFPLMASTARDAAAVTPEAEFGAGLSALLSGLTPR
ncbi:TetR/AcrR family transcriptional regulator C-terminal domain-containing protein [Actinoplanes flavus]|uniref:TetR/AcrR family transcriptional regulator C-terminal domain-containing protein n=1 Tax=Actinoplanes flavus TaxID=2820290 RepID=A0ABS3UII6_9ACTN|nr:TetR/AcrR family transcriptional regulator C-terminal domain-containing protein [Actinoplanes flavus]MBO3738580.1 TetR/AcrR family transcriptional regulator C-terminal domain-containing protein [Actinoplanes flavus]